MEENKQHIDELFRESLGNYTETPPPAVWDAIELRLGGEKRRPAGGFMRWWGWLALLLLAVGGGALVMNKYKKGSNTITAQNTIPKPPAQQATAPVQSAPDSSKTNNTVAAQNTADHADRNSPAAAPTSAPGTAHRHRTGNHSRVARNVRQSTRHNNSATASTKAQNNTVIANNSATNDAPAVAKNHHSNRSNNRSNQSNKSVLSRPAQKTHNREKQAVATNVTEPPVNSVDQPATIPAKTARRPRSRHEIPVASASKPASNRPTHLPKAKVATKNKVTNNLTAPAAASQSSIDEKPTKRTPKALTTPTAAPVVRRPIREPKKPAHIYPLPVAAKPARPPKKHVIAAAPSVVSKPARPPKQPATVAIPPTEPVAKTVKATARTRAPHPSHAPTQPAVAAAKPARQPRSAPTKPVRSRAAKAEPALRNTAAAANNNSRQPLTQGSTGPASLQGKNEDVRFPSARTPEPAIIPKPAAVAPDVTGNPIGDDDADSTSGGEETPYTMNSHRKYTNGLGFSAGIAAGYSFGFSKPAPGEAVIAPYLQYSVSDRISLRLTPTYRFGNVTSQPVSSGDFYRVNNTTVRDTLKPDSGGAVFHYYYLSQSYDSIKTSSSYGGKTWAVDLPITLSFRLGGGFSLFGGPVLSYQNTISLSTSQQVYNKILFDSVVHSFQAINPDTLKARFKHNGVPYSTFNDPAGSSSAAFRLGYTAGLRFNYQRWLAEASIQQNISGTSNITNVTVQKIYTQPYLHFTIGYSLWEPRRRKVETP